MKDRILYVLAGLFLLYAGLPAFGQNQVHWQSKSGEVIDVMTNGVVIQTFTMKKSARPRERAAKVNPEQRQGMVIGPLPDLKSKFTPPPDERIPDEIFFLRNVPGNKEVGRNNEIRFLARATGETFIWKGREIQCWEYGQATNKVEKPQGLAKRLEDETAKSKLIEAERKDFQQKSIEFDQKKAEQEYRVGLAFLNGEGVEKNEAEGIRYLKMAAKDGHALAAAKLKELSVPRQ